MKKAIFAFLLVLLVAWVATAETKYEIAPESIAAPAKCYFDAAGKSDLNALQGCFRDDAVIIDVSRKIAGIKAISRWAQNEVFGGRYEVLQIVSRDADTLKLLIRFAPQGYSQGFKAHYSFEFRDGKIAKMDLQYA